MYDGSLNNLRTQWGAEKFTFSLLHQFPIRLYQWLCQIIMSFGRKQRENAWVAKIPNEEVIISMLISKVVQAFQIKDLKLTKCLQRKLFVTFMKKVLRMGKYIEMIRIRF